MDIQQTMPLVSLVAKRAERLPNEQPTAGACPIHGRPTKRDSCRQCNAAYQRSYLARRRVQAPAKEMWRRAKERARKLGVPFNLPDALVIPEHCPVLGLSLTPGGRRSATSPSLDRIDPTSGYIEGNVRVVSDHANRLKSNRSLDELRSLCTTGPSSLRAEYRKVAEYVEREMLLKGVRLKGSQPGPVGAEWRKIALFLDVQFQKKPL